MPSFTLGLEGADHLTVKIIGPAKFVMRQYDWVEVEVALRTGGFTGAYKASFMIRDFAHFRDGLETLYQC